MPNPGCGCRTCNEDTATFWPPIETTVERFTSDDFYWSFEWHCARSDGWGEWFAYGDEMV